MVERIDGMTQPVTPRRRAITSHRTSPVPHRVPSPDASRRRYLMADPAHLSVEYAINPWMDPTAPFDRERAASQWRALRDTLLGLGHRVDVLPAVAGLPDLVFSANGAVVVDGRALLSRFRHDERRGEEDVHRRWLERRGITVTEATEPIEGEGDVLLVGRTLLAGCGPRTSRSAHEQLRRWSGLEVVSLELVDPRFYHLDTALGVLCDDLVAWYPPAFGAAAQEELRRRHPDAVVVDDHDAALLACNLVSDGRNVVIPAGADHLAADLVARGLHPVHVDVSELLLAGGGPKCCTAEHHTLRSG